jgi:hypothetical protein
VEENRGLQTRTLLAEETPGRTGECTEVKPAVSVDHKLNRQKTIVVILIIIMVVVLCRRQASSIRVRTQKNKMPDRK